MDGHYQMKSMPFDLTNAPAVVQRLIDRVLSPFKSFALAYMDEIVIFSTSFEEHLRHVTAVLDALC
jgi:putative NADPH-quinone reductase